MKRSAGNYGEGTRWARRLVCLLILVGAAATLRRYFALLVIGLEVLAGTLLATNAW